MKKRNLMLLSAIAAASILMTGCGFTADDPAEDVYKRQAFDNVLLF